MEGIGIVNTSFMIRRQYLLPTTTAIQQQYQNPTVVAVTSFSFNTSSRHSAKKTYIGMMIMILTLMPQFFSTTFAFVVQTTTTQIPLRRGIVQQLYRSSSTYEYSITERPFNSPRMTVRTTTASTTTTVRHHPTCPSRIRKTLGGWNHSPFPQYCHGDWKSLLRSSSSTTTATTEGQENVSNNNMVDDSSCSSLEIKIKAKGDEIRTMKENSANKTQVAPFVAELLSLKQQLEQVQNNNNAPPRAATTTTNLVVPKTPSLKKSPVEQETDDTVSSSSNAVLSDSITPRAEDYSKWYNDIIRVTGLAETSPVRGCMVIKPWGMSIWDRIRNELDQVIQDHGAENAYFPLLIPKSFLSKEAEHVNGFAKECAVVTHHRLTTNADNTELIADPDAELEEPLIIRPTSETMIWYMFRKWIVSYRDLPLKVNQWANVMRWEMRTRPFLRTSEFLWQEGHTAHATSTGAEQDANAMMENYATLCQDLLAIPVVRGVKSPSERFAGAVETYTIEALMQNGWALQSGTSHFLGQSFGKAFDVTFQDENGKQQDVWGSSWGVSTRLIGALIMTHSDDAGLVLPPKVAPVQVVIVPIPPKKNDEEAKQLMDDAIRTLMTTMKAAGIRVKLDDREYVRSGAKYFEWERKGVPIRIELGPRDVRANVCILKYRTTAVSDEKITVPLSDVITTVTTGLGQMQQALLLTAQQRLSDGITMATDDGDDVSYDDMKTKLESDDASTYPGYGLYLVPWKCSAENEAKIKEDCKATIRCYPIEANTAGLYKGKKCFYSGDDATHMALFGRAF